MEHKPPDGGLTTFKFRCLAARAYSMLEDDAMEERCLEPLDGVTWWRVTERCNPGGLNLRQAPDKASASLAYRRSRLRCWRSCSRPSPRRRTSRRTCRCSSQPPRP